MMRSPGKFAYHFCYNKFQIFQKNHEISQKLWMEIIANALNALIVFHSNVFIDVLFLSHKQFNYVDL